MISLLAKEFRLILTAWLAAMVLAIMPVWLIPLPLLATACFGIGAAFVGLAPFLGEFNCQTFSGLLVEPRPRIELFWAKAGAAAGGIFVAWLAFYISWRLRANLAAPWVPAAGALLAVVGLGGGLWAALALRQFVASYFAAMAVPGALLSALALVAPAWAANYAVQSLVASVYSLAGLLGARWLFLRAEDIPWTGRSFSVSSDAPIVGKARILGFPRPLRPLLALAQKELQLQHISLLCALGFVVLAGLVIVIMQFLPPPRARSIYPFVTFAFLAILWFLLALSIGSAAVAEERRLGTMQEMVCLPVSRSRTFALKFGMTFLLEALWCSLVLWSPLIMREHSLSNWKHTHWKDAFLSLAAFFALFSVIPFYASTVSRTLFQALAIGIGLFISAMMLFSLAEEILPFFVFVGAPLLWLTLLALSWRNYRDAALNLPLWRQNLAGIAGGFVLALAITLAGYCRLWERFENVEPPHSPPRIAASPQTFLKATICALSVLLPDGRLWMAEDFDLVSKFTNYEGSVVDWCRPKGGQFLPGSNWTDISYDLAIQADGSLWRFAPSGLPPKTRLALAEWPDSAASPPVASLHLPPTLERVGHDSDWKSVHGGMLLKKDGSLWAMPRLLRDEEAVASNYDGGILRISPSSDWVLLGRANQWFAAKENDSLWFWAPTPAAPAHWVPVHLDEPTSPRSTWTSLGWPSVRSDGTIWQPGFARHQESMWLKGIASDARLIGWSVIIRKDGSLVSPSGYFTDTVHWSLLQSMRRFRLSRYSDWIAADGNAVLAADGALCLLDSDEFHRYTLPSRKPIWSLNIFAENSPPHGQPPH